MSRVIFFISLHWRTLICSGASMNFFAPIKFNMRRFINVPVGLSADWIYSIGLKSRMMDSAVFSINGLFRHVVLFMRLQ